MINTENARMMFGPVRERTRRALGLEFLALSVGEVTEFTGYFGIYEHGEDDGDDCPDRYVITRLEDVDGENTYRIHPTREGQFKPSARSDVVIYRRGDVKVRDETTYMEISGYDFIYMLTVIGRKDPVSKQVKGERHPYEARFTPLGSARLEDCIPEEYK